ncbi:hypothetical protein [Poseidonocella sp. HB161398]|uniref:hypothetical protein n=1 Tax=Poseidonocella sp. HB161398 TaxID=2320855 RepID=UPI001108831B|nr:hypothetical protein [Poseidonocella sp. HB161398]
MAKIHFFNALLLLPLLGACEAPEAPLDPYRAVNACVREGAYPEAETPPAGYYYSPEMTVDDAIGTLSAGYVFDDADRQDIRKCADAKLAADAASRPAP